MMFQLNQAEVEVRTCTFQGHFRTAHITLRFPSLFFVEWRTKNGHDASVMLNRRKPSDSIVGLDETLNLTTELLYHKVQKRYMAKESLVHLNLISNSRPDQIKLVGRVPVDLAGVANSNQYAQLATHKLLYCSVQADISFSIAFSKQTRSNRLISELDRSALNDIYTPLSLHSKQGPTCNHPAIHSPKGVVPVQALPVQPVALPNISYQVSKKRQKANREILEGVLPTEQAGVEIEKAVAGEREAMENELCEHKHRIRKLQEDIREVMRMFEHAEEKSQAHLSKLVVSEQALRSSEQQMRQAVEQQRASLEEKHRQQMELLKRAYDVDIQALNSRIEELQGEKSIMEKGREREEFIWKENEALKTNLAELRSEQGKIGMNNLAAKRDMLQAEMGRVEEENTVLNAQLDIMKQKTLNLQKQVAQLKAQIIQKEELVQEGVKSGEKLLKQATEVEMLRQEGRKIQEQLARMGQLELQIEQLQSSIEGMRQQKKTIAEEIAAKEENLKIKRQQTKRISQKLEEVGEQLRREQKRFTQAQQQKEELTNKITKMEEFILQLQHANHASVEEQHQVREEAKERESQLLGELQQVRSQLLGKTEQYNQLMGKVEEQTGEVMRLREEFRQLGEALAGQQQQFKQTQKAHLKQIDQLKTIHLTALTQMEESCKAGQIATIQRQSQEHQERLASINREWAVKVEQIVTQNQKLQKDLRASREVTEQEKKQLCEQLTQLQELNARLKSELKANGSYSSGGEEATQFQCEIRDLSEQICKQAQVIAILQAQLQDKQQQIATLSLKLQQNLTLLPTYQKQQAPRQASSCPEEFVCTQVEIQAGGRREGEQMSAPRPILNLLDSLENSLEGERSLREDHHPPLSSEDIEHITSVGEMEVCLKRQQAILREQNRQLKERLYEMEGKATERSSLLEGLQRERDALRREILEWQEKVTSLQTKIVQLQEKLVSLKRRELQIKESQKQVAVGMSEQLGEVRREGEDWKRKVGQLEAKLDKVRVEKEEGHTLLMGEALTRIASLQEEVRMRDDLLAESECKLREGYQLKYEMGDLREKINELESSLHHREQQLVEELEARISLQKEIESMANHRSDCQEAGCFKLYEMQREQPPPAQSEQPPLGKEVVQLRGELQVLKGELILWQNENTGLRTRVEEALNLNRERQGQLEVVIVERDRLLERLREFEGRFAGEKDMGVANDKLERQLKHCQSELALAQQKIQVLLSNGQQEKIREKERVEEIERLRNEVRQLEEELGVECEKNFLTYHDNQENKARAAELERQLMGMREQYERMTALPIQSFETSTPQKGHTFYNKTSIMQEQPTIRAEVVVADGASPLPNSLSPTLSDAILQTPKSVAGLAVEELGMMREEVESERKMRGDLQALHALCRPKEELLTKQYANCLQQLTLSQQQNLALRQMVGQKQSKHSHRFTFSDIENIVVHPTKDVKVVRGNAEDCENNIVAGTNAEADGEAKETEDAPGEELKTELTVIRQLLADAQAQLNQLTGETQKLRREKEEHLAAICDYQQQLQQLQIHSTEDSKQINNLTSAHKHTQQEMAAEISSVMTELAAATANQDILETELTAARQSLTTLNAENEQQTAQLQQLETQLKKYREKEEMKLQEGRQGEAELASLKFQLESERQKLGEANSRLSQLRMAHEETKQSAYQLESLVTIFTTELQKLQQRGQELRQGHLAQEKQCYELAYIAFALQEQLAQANLTISQQRDEIANLPPSFQEKGDEDDRTDIESKYGKVIRSNEQLLRKNKELLELLGSKTTIALQNNQLLLKVGRVEKEKEALVQALAFKEQELSLKMQKLNQNLRLAVMENKRNDQMHRVEVSEAAKHS